jgi:hypothetical protein
MAVWKRIADRPSFPDRRFRPGGAKTLVFLQMELQRAHPHAGFLARRNAPGQGLEQFVAAGKRIGQGVEDVDHDQGRSGPPPVHGQGDPARRFNLGGFFHKGEATLHEVASLCQGEKKGFSLKLVMNC